MELSTNGPKNGPGEIAARRPIDERLRRIEELRRAGAINDRTYFGMLFFRSVEAQVKASSSEPQSRAAFEAVRDTLQDRTLTRGYAYGHCIRAGEMPPALAKPHGVTENAWAQRGLGIDRRSLAGFVHLVEGAAHAAGEAAGVEPAGALRRAFLGFVRLELSVRVALQGHGKSASASLDSGCIEWGTLESLGGEPDSAHFFSFAELALWRLEEAPHDPFWLTLARAAVAAQPTYLAVHFLARRRAPRTNLDYGPDDVLRDPAELARRLERAPAYDPLHGAGRVELARRMGHHAYLGLLGDGPLDEL